MAQANFLKTNTPLIPAAGRIGIFVKENNIPYLVDEFGVEYPFSIAGSGSVKRSGFSYVATNIFTLPFEPADIIFVSLNGQTLPNDGLAYTVTGTSLTINYDLQADDYIQAVYTTGFVGGSNVSNAEAETIFDNRLELQKDELGGVAANDTTTINVDTIADFATLDWKGRTTAYVKEEGRGGMFNRRPLTDGLTPNGGTIFLANGYFAVREYDGVVNVKWFGAKGDGVTDDTLNLQKAINYIESDAEFPYNVSVNMSKCLYCPSTNEGYLVLGTLTISKPISIEGDGKASTLIKKQGNSPLFRINTDIIINTRHTSIKAMTLQGMAPYDGFDPENSQHGILVENSLPSTFIDSLKIDGVDIVGMQGCGIWSKTNAQTNRISNCKIEGNAGAGIRISGEYNTDFRILTNIIRHNRIGVQFAPDATYYSGSVWIDQNLIEANTMGSGAAGSGDYTSTSLTGRPCIGLSLYRTQRVVITNNYFEYQINDLLWDISSFNIFEGNWGFSSGNVFDITDRYGNGLQRKFGIIGGSGSAGNQFKDNLILDYPKKPNGLSDSLWNPNVWTNTSLVTSQATVTNGSKIVTISTGSWLNGTTLAPIAGFGPKIVFGLDTIEYRVTTRNTDLQITLEESYQGVTGTYDFRILEYGSEYEHVTDMNGINQYIDNIYQGASGSIDEIKIASGFNRHFISGNRYDSIGVSSVRVERSALTEKYFGTRQVDDKTFEHKEILATGAPTKYVTQFPSSSFGFTTEKRSKGGSSGSEIVVQVDSPYGKVSEVWAMDTAQFKRFYGYAAPTTGTYNRGDIVYRREPTSGTQIGWVCVTPGTPGTWEPFGIINGISLDSVLTGYSVGTNTSIASADTVLNAFKKVQGQINARASGTGVNGQISFWNGDNTIGGDVGLAWNNSTKQFTITGDSFPSLSLVRTSDNFSGVQFIGGAISKKMSFGYRKTEDALLTLNDSNIFAGIAVLNSGLVGVQIINPTDTLDVNGTFRARTRTNATGNIATWSPTGVAQERTPIQASDDILKSISGYSAGVAQRLEHDATGTITWVNI